MKLSWKNFVDITTIIWLIIFFVGFYTNENVQRICLIFNTIILFVFLLDLIFIYRKFGRKRDFIKNHWFDVMMIIPYFRIFRIVRSLKFLKVLNKLKVFKFIKKSRILRGTWIAHEVSDLGRTIRQRFGKHNSNLNSNKIFRERKRHGSNT